MMTTMRFPSVMGMVSVLCSRWNAATGSVAMFVAVFMLRGMSSSSALINPL